MSLFSFLAKRKEIKHPVRGKRRFIPRLELLESRDLPSTFTVVNTSGDPTVVGSLPWAIAQSNATQGTNNINFDIPGVGGQVINLTAIQYITNPVVINATTQPGYNGTPLISVQGNSGTSVLFFLTTGSSGSTIEGFDMYDYTGQAVNIIAGSNGNLVQNNYMGFYQDPSNGQVHLNSSLGYGNTGAVGIQTNNNTIRNNVMSGLYNAVSIGEDPAQPWTGKVYSGNTVTSNLFGTDPSGETTANYGNQSDAVFFGLGAQGNYIGPHNVMAGALHGVEFYAPSATGNVIFGNYIGTDATGNHALPNADGIVIGDGASGNVIGGPLGGNVISGNTGAGVNLGVPGFGPAYNNWVQNNIIGLNPTQTAIVGGGSFGVSINSGSTGNHVQSNIICGAANNGVYLQNGSFNTVTGNWLGEASSGAGFANGFYGIAAVQNSDNNYLAGNFFGLNNAGPIYIDPSSTGNYTGNVPTGTTTAAAGIAQIFQDFAIALQDLQSGNVSGFFQEIGDIISLYVSVELQIINSILHSV